MSATVLTQPESASGPQAGRCAAAFFDVDGTLAGTTIVHHYLFFRLRRLPPGVRTLWHGLFLLRCLGYLVLDRIDRNRLNRVFYRNYRGLPVEEIVGEADVCFREVIHPRLRSPGLQCLREHQHAGRAVVLVTGSLDFVIRPLADWIGNVELLAAELTRDGDRFTGQLAGPPLSHEEKARRMRVLAEQRALDLAGSFAYGDSIADLAMLECVGRPHAVNPDARLRRAAEQRGWPVLNWSGAARERGERRS